jgi:hypothetical protein
MASVFFISLLASIFSATRAHAYTQVNVAAPFMNKNIDPIVFPGQYNVSHLHSFYGSDAVTFNTTTSEELRQGCSNADNPNDLSVYWTPTLLYQSGVGWEPVPLSRFSAYYGLGDTPAATSFPENLQMLAGNTKATTATEMPEEAAIEWFCEGDEASTLGQNGFPTRTCSTHLQTLLYFPNCVNTDTLETAYKAGRPGAYYDCPSGMQAMPQLRFSIRYDLREVLPNGWSAEAPLQLACGNAYCSHGDFMNGWTKEAGPALVEAMQSKDEYVSVNGALGKDGDTMDCTATDADPDHGTTDYEESVEAMGKRSVSTAGWVSHSRTMKKAQRS